MPKRITFLRMSDEDKKLLEELSRFYGIAEADVIRIALKEFARNHGWLTNTKTDEKKAEK